MNHPSTPSFFPRVEGWTSQQTGAPYLVPTPAHLLHIVYRIFYFPLFHFDSSQGKSEILCRFEPPQSGKKKHVLLIFIVPSNKSSAAINKLCKQHFDERSDLPRLSRIGIFSCSACDNWREHIHSKGFGKKLPRRDFLSDQHQCR
jgi:hypothetical protein